MDKEKLFFNFEDTKTHFKINLQSIFNCFNFLIQKGLIEDFSETVKSGLQEKYGKHKSSCNYQYEEIDTFDYENESKRAKEFWKEEKEYEEYLKKQNN